MLDAQSPPRPPHLASWRPWQLRADEVRPHFLASPLVAPLIAATPLGEGAFAVVGDVFALTVWYRPRWSEPPWRAEIRDRDWWIPRVPGEDHALYLATRLAAELRAAWEGRNR